MILARINTFLVVAIVAVNLFTLLTPVVPSIMFWFDNRFSNKGQALSAQLQPEDDGQDQTASYPKENRLVVPSMLLDVPILEGKNESVLRDGIWRRPNASTPAQGGNTVIVGHRFTYTNPRGTFYELHRPKPGDEIGVFWEGKRYLYTVTETKVVPATEISVEAPTDSPRLTLYTCTPLWLPKDRLVVIAEPSDTDSPTSPALQTSEDVSP